MIFTNGRTDQTCPSCAAVLVTSGAAESQPLICSNCGVQFRSNGNWPGRKRSRKAVASCVLGVVSIIGLFITGIPALILGSLALGDIRRSPHNLTGKRLALTGAVLGGFFTFAIFLVPMGAAFFFADRIDVSSSQPLLRANNPPPVIPPEAIVLIEPGATWKWFHPVDGVDPKLFDNGFQFLDFDDSGWHSGAESAGALGFGYGDPVDVDIGRPREGHRYSAYFRHTFTTSSQYTSLLLTLYCDDGVVVYLDGEEVARESMPIGSDFYDTAAVDTIGSEDETTVFGIEINVAIPSGSHVLAISLHNTSPTSSDLRIGDIRLYGIPE